MADYDYDYDEKPSSSNKIPLFTLIARVITLASLLISVLLIYNNETSAYNGGMITYKSFDTYGFVCSIMIGGLCYTVLLMPFAGYYLIAKKQLIDHQVFHLFEVIGDKIVFGFLATAAGASLGVTLELQKARWPDGYGAKMRTYLALMHIPNAFLVVGLAGSLVSSILSSLNLYKSE